MLKVQNLGGQRVTAQRKLLFNLLSARGGHLDAGELYVLARKDDPHISIATVYRNLRVFKEVGLVQEHHFAEEHHHYEIKDKKGHQHLVCLGCDKVIEFESPLITKMKDEVSQKNDFDISEVAVYIEGYCESCRKRSA